MIKSTLKLLGRNYAAEGSNVLESITNLKPEVSKGVGVLVLERDGVKKERILPSRIVTGLFGKVSRLNREIAFKYISQMFDVFR